MVNILIVSDNLTYSTILESTISSWTFKDIEIKVLTLTESLSIQLSCEILILDYSNSKKPIINDIKDMKSRFNPIGIIAIIDKFNLLESVNYFEFSNIQVHIKGYDFNQLESFVKSITTLIKNHTRYQSISSQFETINKDFYEPYIFKSEKSLAALKEAEYASKWESNVILLGETGVGKEIFAEIIHRNSKRSSKKKMISINCSLLSKETAYSELFGHEKDAFTGATKKKDGIFTEADGGTLFLDEIGDLHDDVQPQLLRVLNSENTKREFYPKGSTNITYSDVRIIAATNQIKDKTTLNGFREDLFNRFTWVIEIPSLMDRKEEIPNLIDYYIQKFNDSSRHKKSISEEAKLILLRYDFPHNIRELGKIIERAYCRCKKGIIEVENLDSHLQSL